MAKKAQKAPRDKAQEVDQKVAEAIQVILLKHGRALQPFLEYTQFGIVPRLRLVNVTKEINAIENNNQGEVGENQDTDGAAPAEQS